MLDEEGDVISEVDKFCKMVIREHNAACDRGDVVASPDKLYMDLNEIKSRLLEKKIMAVNSLNVEPSDNINSIRFDIKRNPAFLGNFEVLAKKIKERESQGHKVVVVAPTKGQVKRVHELSDEYDLTIDVDTGYLSNGFSCPDLGLTFVAEHEIFGRTSKHRYRRKANRKVFSEDLKI